MPGSRRPRVTQRGTWHTLTKAAGNTLRCDTLRLLQVLPALASEGLAILGAPGAGPWAQTSGWSRVLGTGTGGPGEVPSCVFADSGEREKCL